MLKIIISFLLFCSLLLAQSNNSFDDFEGEFSEKTAEPSWDPLEAYNIPMTTFNDFVYMNVMGPVAKGYRYVVAKPIRIGTSNVFHNILFPVRFVNNILQLKFNNAFEESARFVINSTFGIGGFFDVAKTQGGIERHNEDFGQTLGFYGVGNDIHIVLPLLGPSNLRDAIGILGDTFLDPLYYAQKKELGALEDYNVYILLNTYKIINEYSLHVDEYEDLRKNSVDLYKLLKSVYEQRRDTLIKE